VSQTENILHIILGDNNDDKYGDFSALGRSFGSLKVNSAAFMEGMLT
jgi:hypothetical protein